MFPKKHSAALVLLFGLLLHNTVAQQNILIHQPTSGDYAPCEPSIAINPKNPAEIVAGAVLDYVYTSLDSGKTWTSKTMTSQHGVYGDPCIIADDKNHFYYFHLSNPSGEG